MTRDKIPPGLYDVLMTREGHRCLRCGARGPLEVHHLIARGMGGSLPKNLRWDPKNLAVLCDSCHHGATDGKDGYEEWAVSRFGDLAKNLEAFWKWFRRAYKDNAGGWRSVETFTAPSPHAVQVRIATENLTKGLPTCTLFKAYLRQAREGFLDSARLAEKIYDEELWRETGAETLEEWLADPEVGLKRDYFYRVAQVGRFLRLSGMTDAPVLTERKWLKMLPEVKGLAEGKIEEPETVKELVEQAQVLTNKDFEILLSERRNKRKHPDIPVLIPQDAMVLNEKGDQIGGLHWVKVGHEAHVLCLSIATVHVKMPMTIVLR